MTIWFPRSVNWEYMHNMGMWWRPWVRISDKDFDQMLNHSAEQHPEEMRSEYRARAIARCAWKKYGDGKRFWFCAAVIAIILVVASIPAFSQTGKVNVIQVGGNSVTTSLPVTCISGCTGGPGGGGTSSNFSAAFPASGTAAGASDGVNMKPLLVDASGYLKTILQNSSLAVTGTFWQSVQPVSGSVSVSNFPASQAVTGTFWQSIQPVSGTVSVNVISGFALETGGNLASIKTNTDKIPSLGQALAAGSVPVVLPTAQITTLTPPAALTNFALETGGNLASIKTDVDKIPSQGQALAAGSMPVVLPAAQITTLTPLSSVTVIQGTGTNLHAVLDASTAVIGHVINDASTAVIGHVIADSGSTTAVTGNVASTVADGANVLLGAKADAKSTATDTTAVSAMSVLKQISASVQAPPSQAVTNAGTFPTQATLAAGSAIAGKFGIDQTTPGTTNAVEVTASTDSSIGLTATSKGAVTTAVNVKSSAGNLYGVFILNGAVATCWLELINSATAGSLGTGVIMNIPMASGGIQYLQFNPPIGGFTSGIAVGSASAIGGASACGTAATGVTVIYK